MTPNPYVVITVNLHPGRAEVRLELDGAATVHLRAVMVARKDVTGRIAFDVDTTVTSNRVEDSFVSTPLRPHVLRAAENRARTCLRLARKATARVLAAHTGSPQRQVGPHASDHCGASRVERGRHETGALPIRRHTRVAMLREALGHAERAGVP